MSEKKLLMTRGQYLRDAAVNVVLGGAIGCLLGFILWGPK